MKTTFFSLKHLSPNLMKLYSLLCETLLINTALARIYLTSLESTPSFSSIDFFQSPSVSTVFVGPLIPLYNLLPSSRCEFNFATDSIPRFSDNFKESELNRSIIGFPTKFPVNLNSTTEKKKSINVANKKTNRTFLWLPVCDAKALGCIVYAQVYV